MARRRGRSRSGRVRTVYRSVARRGRGRRRSSGMGWKRIAKGAGIGAAVSIGSYMLSRYMVERDNSQVGNALITRDAGQRIGSVAAAKFGGWGGNAAYQAIDFIFDNFISPRTGGRVGSGSSVSVI